MRRFVGILALPLAMPLTAQHAHDGARALPSGSVDRSWSMASH